MEPVEISSFPMLVVPVNNEQSKQRFITRIDTDRSYTLRLHYIDRAGGWYMHVETVDGVRILSGIRLVAGYSLVSRYASEELPQGVLFVSDSTDLNKEPTRESLGVDTQIFYIQPEQLANLEALIAANGGDDFPGFVLVP